MFSQRTRHKSSGHIIANISAVQLKGPCLDECLACDVDVSLLSAFGAVALPLHAFRLHLCPLLSAFWIAAGVLILFPCAARLTIQASLSSPRHVRHGGKQLLAGLAGQPSISKLLDRLPGLFLAGLACDAPRRHGDHLRDEICYWLRGITFAALQVCRLLQAREAAVAFGRGLLL